MEMCRDSDRVVSLVEKFRLKKWFYIVSKYVSGGNLMDYCLRHGGDGHGEAHEQPSLSEDRIHYIFSQIAHGLHDMHKIGLIHRDLKHDNIFLSDNSKKPRIKIGDLGLTAYLKPDEVLIKFAGTKAFMAPEVLLDQPAGFYNDIYSLGVILYTLVANSLPFSEVFYVEGNEMHLLEQEIEF